ncbi:hypothetical protein LAUMK4_01596 [Mycobacterium persicum]|uniref:Uncharacterized protein n=1 Tax=Mycobacterium persicum TaxID=1487726 RepID=A0ABY6RFL9_9MYCO|nr:hypothetical protein LAUMK4_01596 [Mycobacterium persicum]
MVQELALEFGMLAPQDLNDGMGIEPRIERIPCQVGDRRRHHAAVHGHQVSKQPPAEGALVGKAQHGPVVEQGGDPDVVGARHCSQQHLPAHAQVHHKRAIRAIQRQPQVLAAPVGSGNPRAQQPRRQVGGSGLVAPNRPGVMDPDRGQRLAHHMGR